MLLLAGLRKMRWPLTACLAGMLLACGWILGFGEGVQAAVGIRYVDVNGQCGGNEPCHSKIGDAVNTSQLAETIIVYPGTYTENVKVDIVSLTIRSKDGPQNTRVQADNPNRPVFGIHTDGVTIAGFTIEGAYLFSDGVAITASHTMIVSNTITGNHKGIQIVDGSHTTIQGNDISRNKYWSSSDGVYIFAGDHITLTGNLIADNRDEGIQLEMGSVGGEYLNIYNSEVISNGGEGIYFGWSEYLVISNTRVMSNGLNGVYTSSSEHISLRGCTLAGNQANGMHSTYGLDISIKSCDIMSNQGNGVLLETGESEIPDTWGEALSFNHNYSLVASRVILNGGDGVNWGLIPISGTIVGNIVGANLGHGITFGGRTILISEDEIRVWLATTGHRIGFNRILGNGIDGLYLLQSGNNLIYLNDFIQNGPAGDVHAVLHYGPDIPRPYGVNIWHSPVMTYTYAGRAFSGELGNYWEGFDPPDADGNGVRDIAYEISATEPADSQLDTFPLVLPFETYLAPAPGPPEQMIFFPVVIR